MRSRRDAGPRALHPAVTRLYLGSSLVSWSSERRPTVSRSSAEAEYRDVANAVAECTWLRQLLSELSSPVDKATVVFCDNVSAVYLSANPVHHRRTKHIELDIHFVREQVALGRVRLACSSIREEEEVEGRRSSSACIRRRCRHSRRLGPQGSSGSRCPRRPPAPAPAPAPVQQHQHQQSSELGAVGFDEEALAAAAAGEEGASGGAGGNRWPRQETLALLKIRSDMDAAFRDATLKGPLWEEVSR
ncbi:hypothetical protein QYE76_012022 [Lolium multiflorum]|uniref:Uncharacterized protein n=1 Tax=Lolium multiflorum TaxID=4521 RepID=A0AAD8U0A8_LOLMU|nr:hypothetical protein QYE76_012022 [Lolium multiflorum]